MDKNNSLVSQDRILDICNVAGAKSYINAIGGQALYDKKKFAINGINISFLKTRPLVYKQFGESFIPNLSIIDVMMFQSKNEVRHLLELFDLV